MFNVLNWIKGLIRGGGYNSEIAGMNAEQAAAYFAKKKAEEEAAQMGGNAPAGTWPQGELKFTTRTLESAELQEEVEEITREIQRISKHVGDIQEILDTKEKTDLMNSLLEQMQISHELVAKFKHELQRLHELLKIEAQDNTVKIVNAPKTPDAQPQK